jgi:hypothetical protein
MATGVYSINDYYISGYWCLLVNILLWILLVINGIILVVIGEYFIVDIAGY